MPNDRARDNSSTERAQDTKAVDSNNADAVAVYDETTLNRLRETSKGYFSGAITGYPLEESMERVRKRLSKS